MDPQYVRTLLGEIRKRLTEIEGEIGDDIFVPPVRIDAAKAPAPLAPNWRDWRMTHAGIFVLRPGADGDASDWERLFLYAGVDTMNFMYDYLRKADPMKPIYYSVAAKWIEDNTTEEKAS